MWDASVIFSKQQELYGAVADIGRLYSREILDADEDGETSQQELNAVKASYWTTPSNYRVRCYDDPSTDFPTSSFPEDVIYCTLSMKYEDVELSTGLLPLSGDVGVYSITPAYPEV